MREIGGEWGRKDWVRLGIRFPAFGLEELSRDVWQEKLRCRMFRQSQEVSG